MAGPVAHISALATDQELREPLQVHPKQATGERLSSWLPMELRMPRVAPGHSGTTHLGTSPAAAYIATKRSSKYHEDRPFVLDYYHEDHPFELQCEGSHHVGYIPGESTSDLFGGNSNWRGPIWICMNYLVIESLNRYDYFYGGELTVECPTGSGREMRLSDVAHELNRRMSALFMPDTAGRRPCHGGAEKYTDDPFWKDLVLFYEYFHGDTGKGLGASHQTGWTALIANTMMECKPVKPAAPSAPSDARSTTRGAGTSPDARSTTRGRQRRQERAKGAKSRGRRQ
ncbi:PREDICTED: uncharacterized protein YMR196W-like [Priapulus caudatus]|uniref:Uncharacterized protein YMR196W-like n=1 Tax=Priapulus caudatus TaxID=37621 RepID=A0ABM1EPW1_PRICU|nr:PREDICTED: uncharacterized protein YMR196W-like [Priapulus caudatus]